jgi:hypothetical protein
MRWSLAGLLAVVSPLVAAAEVPRFEAQVLDPEIGKVCYAVTTADVNGDGKLDVVAVSENRVLWYENPSWTKHVILEDQTEKDNVCIAAHDIDGDGKVDFALGAGWTKIGTLQWITRGDKPDDKWKVHLIGQETWLHRMSFADVLGTGRPQLLISPLNKTVADGVRLTAFEIPKQPRTDRWPPTVLDATLNRMHNHTHVEWNQASPIETIVAAEQGVYLLSRDRNGEFVKSLLGTGMPGTTPETKGAGEIKVGKLTSGERFLATVEPMHGTAAVVYLQTDALGPWKRVVLDETLKQGHAVWTVDLDGDGGDEVVIGHREPGPGPVKGPGLYAFQASDKSGTTWAKHVIDDGGVAVEDALAADFNGDGKPDLVAGGRATHNVKLYWNKTPTRPTSK